MTRVYRNASVTLTGALPRYKRAKHTDRALPNGKVESRTIDPRVYEEALRIVNGDKSRIVPDPDCENGVIIKPERL